MSQKMFRENNVTIDDVIESLHDNGDKNTRIYFPFDCSLAGNPNEILTKILFINYLESTQIKNKDIENLKEHIERVMCDRDFEVICQGELNEEYFSVVDKIAFGHGIKRKNTTENNLTSFASKFCGSHNQKAPFWDNLVFNFLKYLGYKHEYRNYRAYVAAFKKLQKEHDLTEYSLREIEGNMWKVAKEKIIF